MIIGVVHCECLLYNAQSLKDKRAVLNSIKSRIKNRYNVSISEVDFQDVWQRTELAMAVVSNTKQTAEQELQRAISIIDQNTEIELTEATYEWL